jgi:hypothetical protein
MKKRHLQERTTVVSVVGDELVPAGGGVGRGITPGVVVQRVKVGAGTVIVTTVEELGKLVLIFGNISSGISDWDFSQTLSRQVGLHVADNGLDVWRAVGVGGGIDDLVTGKEAQGVVVAGKCIDGGKYTL